MWITQRRAPCMHAVQKFYKYGKILAYLIAGHHAGLPDWFTEKEGSSALSSRLEKEELLTAALQAIIPPSFLELPERQINFKPRSLALWIRMLFSCFVDADFLETGIYIQSFESLYHPVKGFLEDQDLDPRDFYIS